MDTLARIGVSRPPHPKRDGSAIGCRESSSLPPLPQGLDQSPRALRPRLLPFPGSEIASPVSRTASKTGARPTFPPPPHIRATAIQGGCHCRSYSLPENGATRLFGMPSHVLWFPGFHHCHARSPATACPAGQASRTSAPGGHARHSCPRSSHCGIAGAWTVAVNPLPWLPR